MAARITLTVAGKDHMFNSLRDAAAAVREKQVPIEAAERAMLDAFIEFGEWLIALKRVSGHGNWTAYLQSCGIHVKRAQRAMRLAGADGILWPAKGESKNDSMSFLTEAGGGNVKQGRLSERPRSAYEAEKLLAARKPEPLVMEGYGPEGDEDFEEGDMEGHEMDGETERVPLTSDPRGPGVYVPPRKTAVTPATGGQMTLASLYERDIAPHLAAVIESLGRAEAGVSVELIADVRALRDRIARAMKGGA